MARTRRCCTVTFCCLLSRARCNLPVLSCAAIIFSCFEKALSNSVPITDNGIAKKKEPINMTNIATILPEKVSGTMSPYPTVVIVMIKKYVVDNKSGNSHPL